MSGAVAERVRAALAALDEAEALGAVAFRDDEAVLALAEAADERAARGEWTGPLHGWPVTVKDWIDAVGFPCAGGESAQRGRRPERDATVVARLRAAGAIVVAKATAGEHHLDGRPVRNPWAPERVAGLSSSGDAVAVALGAVAAGVGSDSGGSLRFPAHCCGLATLRPTFGRVPLTGHFPRVGAHGDGRTVIGPLGPDIATVRAVHAVIAGPDGLDPGTPPVADPERVPVKGLRVVRHLGARPLPPAVVAAVDRATSALDRAGAAVVDGDVLAEDEALDLTRRYWSRGQGSGAEVDEQLQAWDRFARRGLRVLQGADAVLTPVAPDVAPLVGEVTVDVWRFLLTGSLWGWPSAVVPAGQDHGLPIGVQLMAGPWQESRCLDLAEVVERDLGPLALTRRPTP